MKLTPILSTVVAGCLLASFAPAQGPDQAELAKRHADKLAKAFVKDGGWITDFDEARAKSEKSGKPLFVYFTRSYAP